MGEATLSALRVSSSGRVGWERAACKLLGSRLPLDAFAVYRWRRADSPHHSGTSPGRPHRSPSPLTLTLALAHTHTRTLTLALIFEPPGGKRGG